MSVSTSTPPPVRPGAVPNRHTHTASDVGPSTAWRAVTSLAVLCLLSGVYQYGLIFASRQSVLLEAVVSLVLPVLCLAGGWFRHPVRRLTELVLIETFLFNLIVVISKVAVANERDSVNAACGFGFIAYFVVQGAGFLWNQLRLQSVHGIFQTLVGLALIFNWIADTYPTPNRIDATGAYLPFGSDAPLPVQLVYACWLVTIVLVNSPSLPRLTLATTNLVSLGLAIGSGEFFHARILTACNLFVLTMAFGGYYTEPLGRGFAVVPDRFRTPPAWVKAAVPWAISLACLALGVWTLSQGSARLPRG